MSKDLYEAVIGLEVHAQVKTATKMFCGCKNEFGAEQNTNVCPVCLGYPGALPTPNEEAIVKTIALGLMLHCKIAEVCKFDRKNYFYPDMPKNYQISQYDQPLCLGGRVDLYTLAFPKDAQKEPQALEPRSIRIHRIHLEEDVAKSFHFEGHSGIDFNRAGTPLMEIVSEADLRTPEEAFAYLTALRQILVYGNISDADMEKGQMRCDVNISVRKRGTEALGTKCEIKNLNSISAVRRSLAYEIERQIEVMSSGGTIRQETRRWDDARGQTFVMRTKEQAHDYRYFPDPDLMPLRTDTGLLEKARSLVPELPAAKKARFTREYGLSEYQASVLASERSFADYFEAAAREARQPVLVANYLTNDYLAAHDISEPVKIASSRLAALANLVDAGKINSKQAKEVLVAMLETGEDPEAIVKARGMSQVTDVSTLEALCVEAIAANPRSVADYKAGKQAAINAFKGFIMKATKGQANPQLVDEVLRRKLAE